MKLLFALTRRFCSRIIISKNSFESLHALLSLICLLNLGPLSSIVRSIRSFASLLLEERVPQSQSCRVWVHSNDRTLFGTGDGFVCLDLAIGIFLLVSSSRDSLFELLRLVEEGRGNIMRSFKAGFVIWFGALPFLCSSRLEIGLDLVLYLLEEKIRLLFYHLGKQVLVVFL